MSFSKLQTTRGGEIFQPSNPSCRDSSAELQPPHEIPPHEIGALKRLYEGRLHRKRRGFMAQQPSTRIPRHGNNAQLGSGRSRTGGKWSWTRNPPPRVPTCRSCASAPPGKRPKPNARGCAGFQ